MLFIWDEINQKIISFYIYMKWQKAFVQLCFPIKLVTSRETTKMTDSLSFSHRTKIAKRAYLKNSWDFVIFFCKDNMHTEGEGLGWLDTKFPDVGRKKNVMTKKGPKKILNPIRQKTLGRPDDLNDFGAIFKCSKFVRGQQC